MPHIEIEKLKRKLADFTALSGNKQFKIYIEYIIQKKPNITKEDLFQKIDQFYYEYQGDKSSQVFMFKNYISDII